MLQHKKEKVFTLALLEFVSDPLFATSKKEEGWTGSHSGTWPPLPMEPPETVDPLCKTWLSLQTKTQQG